MMSLVVYIVSVFFKLLTITERIYHSTDFEVHRNWLAITHSLPFSQWYTEATSIWTLDYPPFFAYFEWFLSVFAHYFDPAMLIVSNLEYVSKATIIFQRLSVILISDGILAFGIYMSASKNVSLVLSLFSSTLFIVDHIHFQYNGMMLGLLLLSIGLVESGKFYSAALTYAVLIFTKHIFVFAAPVFLMFYLRHFIYPSPSVSRALLRIGGLVLILGGVAVAAIGPLVYTNQLEAAMRRLFPFGRGLMHANWPPNFWALYLATDRVAAKLAGIPGLNNSPTRGLVGITSTVVLPEITPQISFAIVGIIYSLLLLFVWRKSYGQSFAVWVGFGNAIAFEFGYHVHEKALLMILFPLLLHASIKGDTEKKLYKLLSLASCVTVFPLLFNETDNVLKWTICLAGFSLEQTLLTSQRSISDTALALSSIAPEFYRVAVHGVWIFKNNEYPFIPIMLNSVVNALLIGIVLIRYFMHVLKTQPHKYVKSSPM